MVKFSIIIPVYNIQDYIEECINSVLEQSYKSYEIILVNDGSTDNSGRICEEFASKISGVKVIHKKNGGLSSARNEGIKVANGDYLMFLDGDDFIKEEALKNLSEVIYDFPNIDLICGKFIKLSPSGNFQYEKFQFPNVNRMSGVEGLTSFFKNIPIIMWSACRTIFKTSFFKENNFKFKEGITSEDLELIPKIYMKASSIAVCNKPFYIYRLGRSESIINTVNEKRFYDVINIIKSYLEILENDKNKNFEFIKFFKEQLANIYVRYLLLLNELPSKKFLKVFNEMLELKFIIDSSSSRRGTYIKIFRKIIGYKNSIKLYYNFKVFNYFLKNFFSKPKSYIGGKFN